MSVDIKLKYDEAEWLHTLLFCCVSGDVQIANSIRNKLYAQGSRHNPAITENFRVIVHRSGMKDGKMHDMDRPGVLGYVAWPMASGSLNYLDVAKKEKDG